MNRNFFILGSVLAGLAVAIGAYGAHGGAEYLTDESSITFGKAVRYQMHHALALLAVALAFAQWPNRKKVLNFAGYSYSFINDRGINSLTQEQQTYHGLPVIGFAFQTYINSNAQPGLLATYASAKAHYGEMLITEDDDIE